MISWPKVWLIFATYKRTLTCLKTLDSLHEHLIYPNLHWHVADDGSGETDDGTHRDHVQVCMDHIRQWYPGVTGHSMNTPPGSFNTGGNINEGIRLARENGVPVHMLNFDDWALINDLDLCPLADIVDSNPNVGMIRLSYLVPGLGAHSVRYDGPKTGRRWIFWRLIRDWTLHNPWYSDRYMVSTQPYIAHYRFFEAYGMHPEHVSPGEAELKLGDQYIQSPLGEDGPQILFPVGARMAQVTAPYEHIAYRAHDHLEQFGLMP